MRGFVLKERAGLFQGEALSFFVVCRKYDNTGTGRKKQEEAFTELIFSRINIHQDVSQSDFYL